jgi:hypothetical protein
VLIAIDRGAASVIPGEKLGQQSKSRIRRLLDFFAGEKKQNARIDGVDSSITGSRPSCCAQRCSQLAFTGPLLWQPCKQGLDAPHLSGLGRS